MSRAKPRRSFFPLASSFSSPIRRTCGEKSGSIVPLVLMSAVILNIFLCVYRINDFSLWYDELSTVEDSCGATHRAHNILRERKFEVLPRLTNAEGGVMGVFRNMTYLQPPLHFMAVRLMRDMWGNTDFAVRFPSLFSSAVSVVLTYAIGKLLYGREGAGLWAGFLTAVSASVILRGIDARAYMMGVMFALLAWASVLAVKRNGVRNLYVIGIFAGAFGTAMSHYFAVPVLFSLFIYSFWGMKGNSRIWVIGTFAAAALLFVVVWGESLYRQLIFHRSLESNIDYYYSRDPNGRVQALLSLLAVPYHAFRVQSPTDGILMPGLAGLAALGLVVIFGRPNKNAWLAAGWIACGILPMFLLDMVVGSNVTSAYRYQAFASMGFIILIAGCSPRRFVVPLVFAVFTIISLPTVYKNRMYLGMRPSVIALAPALERGGPILMAFPKERQNRGSGLLRAIDWYWDGARRSPIVIIDPPQNGLIRLPKEARDGKYEYVWLVTSNDGGSVEVEGGEIIESKPVNPYNPYAIVHTVRLIRGSEPASKLSIRNGGVTIVTPAPEGGRLQYALAGSRRPCATPAGPAPVV